MKALKEALLNGSVLTVKGMGSEPPYFHLELMWLGKNAIFHTSDNIQEGLKYLENKLIERVVRNEMHKSEI